MSVFITWQCDRVVFFYRIYSGHILALPKIKGFKCLILLEDI